MLDFTSALYLGIRHPSGSLRPWDQFTTGVPSALASPACTRALTRALARLQGCERATVGPSTLHLFWDLFGMLAGGVSIYMDAGVYSIARWGIERAAARGASFQSFPHHDADALRRRLEKYARGRARPLVVTDGFCPVCGKPAPIAEYLESARAYGGRLILDDTQALGILGDSPGPGAPYGKGGGGMMRYSGVGGPDVLAISSLAKGFGAPMAVLSGSADEVSGFEAKSDTRVHCSPPSIAVLHAAQHALALNHQGGDALRLRLARLVWRFRERLKEAGLTTTGGLFPVQTLANVSGTDARSVHERLLRVGIKAVLRRSNNGGSAQISFIITALHAADEIDRLADAIAYAARKKGHSKNFRSENHELQA